MGPIKWFLGMHVSRNHRLRTISLSQDAYIDTFLRRFSMTDAYGVSTLLDPNVILSMTMSPSTEKQKAAMQKIPYLAGVRPLMYASIATHPDITFATNKISQFNSNPGLAHWTTLQHVLHYLKQTCDYSLTLGGTQKAILVGYTDSDFASCTNTRCYMSDYLFTLGSSPISQSSK